ncbi:hypothetical protein ZWY2020_003405 [Hordeum vulgare]|nr:hypothetical protein ZWY2020_003405 [Hordeum vulgare]
MVTFAQSAVANLKTLENALEAEQAQREAIFRDGVNVGRYAKNCYHKVHTDLTARMAELEAAKGGGRAGEASSAVTGQSSSSRPRRRQREPPASEDDSASARPVSTSGGGGSGSGDQDLCTQGHTICSSCHDKLPDTDKTQVERGIDLVATSAGGEGLRWLTD